MSFDSIDKFNAQLDSISGQAAAAIYHQLSGSGRIPILGIELLGDSAWSYMSTPEGLQVSAGASDADVTLQLQSRDWARLASRERTVAGLLYERNATIVGCYADYPHWELILEHLLHGDGLYTREKAEHYRKKIAAGEVNQAFYLDNIPAAIRFMREWGFVRIRSVFSNDEINSMRTEIGKVVKKTKAEQKDSTGAWWTQDGSDQIELARVNYLGTKSDLIAQLHRHPAIKRIIQATGLEVTPMTDRMDGEFITLKTTNSKEKDNFTNLPWHKDCGLGLHKAICPSCIIGIQLTPASNKSGQLQVLAGSHDSANNAATIDWLGEDAPVVGLETEAGDLTLHYSHVLHAAPPPLDPGVGRQTLYIQFYPKAIKDHVKRGKGLNDIVLEFSGGGAVKPLKDLLAEKA